MIITLALLIGGDIGDLFDAVVIVEQVANRSVAAPRIEVALRAARGLLPLRLGRQAPVDEGAIIRALRIVQADDRIVGMCGVFEGEVIDGVGRLALAGLQAEGSTADW